MASFLIVIFEYYLWFEFIPSPITGEISIFFVNFLDLYSSNILYSFSGLNQGGDWKKLMRRFENLIKRFDVNPPKTRILFSFYIFRF